MSTPHPHGNDRVIPQHLRARPLAPHTITLRGCGDGAAGRRWRTARAAATARTAARAASSAGRVPPHNLQAEESVLGALLLSRDAIGAGQRAGAAPRGLLPPGPPAHLRRRARPVLDGCAGRHDHRRRRAAPRRPARAGRRHRGAARPAERHAGDLQRRPLRPHRPGHGAAAPPDPRRRRHRRDGLLRARRRHEGRRRRRVEGLQGRRGPRHRLDPAAQRVDQGGDGPARGDVRPGRHDHRHGHRLPRHRRAAVGPAALDAEHRRRPPGHGQDGVRPRHGGARRPDDGQAGPRVLPRDGAQRADPAHPVERGQGRLVEDAQRPHQRGRLGPHRPGDRAPRGAAVPRRQPARDGRWRSAPRRGG